MVVLIRGAMEQYSDFRFIVWSIRTFRILRYKGTIYENIGKVRSWSVLCVVIVGLFLGLVQVSAQSAVPQELLGSFARPGFITSAGQTSDAAIVKVLANTRLKLGLDYDIAAKPQAIAGAKTLILVLGVSNKGLGAAGMSIEQEIERVKNIIAEAQKNGTRIISMHTGGTARRGDASNQIIEVCVPASTVVIVVEAGITMGFLPRCVRRTMFLCCRSLRSQKRVMC